MSDPLAPRADRRGTDAHGHDVLEPLHVALLTVSSSRDRGDDPGGDRADALVHEAGHRVVERAIVADDYGIIRTTVARLSRHPDVDCVIATGGTGVTADDVTPDACASLFDRELPGFGEAFRRLSWDAIGHRAIASRACAGLLGPVPVFCVPGSPNAVETACTELILPEGPHLAGLASATRE